MQELKPMASSGPPQSIYAHVDQSVGRVRYLDTPPPPPPLERDTPLQQPVYIVYTPV